MAQLVRYLCWLGFALAIAAAADASIVVPAFPDYQLDVASLEGTAESSAKGSDYLPEDPSDQPADQDHAVDVPLGAVPVPTSSSSNTAPSVTPTSVLAGVHTVLVAELGCTGWVLEERGLHLLPRVGNDLLRPPRATTAV